MSSLRPLQTSGSRFRLRTRLAGPSDKVASRSGRADPGWTIYIPKLLQRGPPSLLGGSLLPPAQSGGLSAQLPHPQDEQLRRCFCS